MPPPPLALRLGLVEIGRCKLGFGIATSDGRGAVGWLESGLRGLGPLVVGLWWAAPASHAVVASRPVWSPECQVTSVAIGCSVLTE
jgi:hypothetical protein